MKTTMLRTALLCGLLPAFFTLAVRSQTVPPVDCDCLLKLPELRTNACQAVVPDLCLLATNCFSSNVVASFPGYCSQTPAAGTPVGPGTTYISLIVMDNQGLATQCQVPFVVSPAAGCLFTLICPTNKTVECGSGWSFDPPTWTNACAPPIGTVSNGVLLAIVSTVTNGSCPAVITRTWQAVDDCGNKDLCSQTVTVVDTTPPQLDCKCLTNNPVFPLKLTVVACTSTVPDLCLAANICASDNCGVVGCDQSPPPGTLVGVGVHPITVAVYDCASNAASCVVDFTVLAPAGGCGTNPCVPPPSGMVGWWPLDELTGASVYVDLSANGNTALVESGGPVGNSGSPLAVAGKVAGAGYFYQPTSRGRAPNAPSLNFGTGSFSLDGWVNPIATGPVHWHPIVDKYLATGLGTGFGYMVGLLNTKVVLRVGDGTMAAYTSVGSVTYGVWNFVAVAVDRAANTVTFHVNGTTEPSQPLAPAGSFNSPVDLLIGGMYALNQPHGEIALDEIELFNRALTNAEFSLLWQAGAAGKCKPDCNHYERIWNTGMGGDRGDVPLAGGTPDPNYVLISAPPGGCTGPAQVLMPSTLPAPPWMTNGPGSQWIGAGPTALCQGGVYHYRLCFELTCTDGASVVGQWSADDFAVVMLNGQPTGNTIPSTQFPYSFSGWHPISLTNGFVCGVNCLDFYVTNALTFDNPTGFRAQLTNVFNDCCCAATQTLFTVNTGVGANGLLPQGAPDPQLALTCAPKGISLTPPVVTQPSPYWMPNGPNSQWVGPFAALTDAPGGVYCYTLTFDIPCPTNVPIRASLNGQWMADDTGTIYLNGQPTGNTLPNGWAFTNWQAIAITSGFLPGLNTLTFYVTNGFWSPTGIRLELTGSVSCCDCSSNACQASISCPTNMTVTTCTAAGATVYYPLPTAMSTCGTIASLTCSPPSGSVFPVGTNTVTCTAIDTLGNSATCTFTIVVRQIGKPVAIKCPPNQILYTCGSNAVAYYKGHASGQVGPIAYSPPSGSIFPLGTNVVTCTATNACGEVATCQFLVIVKPYPLGPPMVLQAGLPDNFALPVEASPQTACMVAAFSGFPYWKGFDDAAVNTLFGHHFAGLPNNIVQAQLIIRMKPGNDSGSDNDGLFIGLPSCAFSSFIFGGSIKALAGAVPPTGGTWIASSNGPTTFTLNLNAALLAHMNSAQVLDVVVHDDTIVDYMQLKLWRCPPPFINDGVPHWTDQGADQGSSLAVMPPPELPAFGPLGTDPALSLGPPNGDPALPNNVEIGLGGGQGFSFTTVLDMNAPVGAQIVISAPTGDGTHAPLLTLTRTCTPQCGWEVVKAKRYDEGTSESRVSAVNSNGHLLDSFTAPDGSPEPPLTLYPQEGIPQFPVSILLDAVSGEITLTFPGEVARRLCNGLPCPRGWDGTIKGRVTEEGLRKGWDGTVKCPCYDEGASRVVFTPLGSYHPVPRPSLLIRSTGLEELVLASEQLLTMGRHIVRAAHGEGDSTAMFQGTPEGDGVLLTPSADGSGVSVDLGRSTSFDIGFDSSRFSGLVAPEQLFRLYTNRPGPGPTNPPIPPIDLWLKQGSDGVECYVDFTMLAAKRVTALLYTNGTLIASGSVEGPSNLPDQPLVIDRWPQRIGVMQGDGTLRLLTSEPFNIQGFVCDEVRFSGELPPGTPTVPFYGELSFFGAAGVDYLLYDLQQVSACVPGTLEIVPTPAGTVLRWSAQGSRLLGAEQPEGPWIDLGVESPVTLSPDASRRYFRLVCD